MARYRLLKKLAKGGMAEVFLAEAVGREGFKKTVVIKRIHPHLSDDETFVEMFLQEARLAAQLTHPNIAQVYDLGRFGELPFISMEYVDGPNLRDVLKRSARRGVLLPVEVSTKIVALACEGLAYAHELNGEQGPLNLIHRDISPENIMVSAGGVVKLVDFGIAKASTSAKLTQAGTIKGKLSYMSPEQVRGRQLDLRSDLYSLAAVLYELLAGGGRPYSQTGTRELMQAIAYEPHRSILELRPDVPRELVAVLDKGLAKDREGRYANCRELAAELEGFLVRRGAYIPGAAIAAAIQEVLSSPPTGTFSSYSGVSSLPSGDLGVLEGTSRTPERSEGAVGLESEGGGAVGGSDRDLVETRISGPPEAETRIPEPAGGDTRIADRAAAETRIAQRPDFETRIAERPEDKTRISPSPLETAAGAQEDRSAVEGREARAEAPPEGTSGSPGRRRWMVALALGLAVVLGLAFMKLLSPSDLPSEGLPRSAVVSAESGSATEPVQVPEAIPRAAPMEAPPVPAPPTEGVPGSASAEVTEEPAAPEPASVEGAEEPALPDGNEAAASADEAEGTEEAQASSGAAARSPELGALAITSRPRCEVLIGETSHGTAPVKIEDLAPGPYVVTLRERKLGLTRRENVVVEAGQVARLNVRFPSGKLAVRVKPYAEVFVDGRRHGMTPLPPISLVEGTHQVELRYDGAAGGKAEKRVRQVRVRGGAEVRVLEVFEQ